MSKPRVLVAGASVGGPALAYWLVKAGCTVTIVERSSDLRLNGQSIDVRNDGVRIIRKMGIEESIREKTTKEAGVQMVLSNGSVIATFGATGIAEEQSFTSEFEIFRGDLAKILYDITKNTTEYIFGDYIKSLTQNDKAGTVTAEFHNGTPTRTFDLVVGADGLNSKTRAMAFGTDVREHIKCLNAYTAWFTVEKDLLNGSTFAQFYHNTGGRLATLRPDPKGHTRAFFSLVGPNGEQTAIEPFLAAEQSGDRERVKDMMAKLFKDAGWVCGELVESMYKATDFYSGELAQVYTPTLSRGRIALVGDAAFSPSAISGSGTTCAFVSAYVLAGEINKSLKAGEDLDEALRRYDTEMIPRARKCQKLLPGAPAIVNPQTLLGLWFMRTIIAVVSFLRIDRLVWKLSGVASFTEGSGLPDYKWDA